MKWRNRLFFKTPQQWFLVTALSFGLLYSLIVPPFQAPDETNHFYRAYHLSEGHLMGVTRPDHRLGGVLPASLLDIYQPFARLRYNYTARVSPNELTQVAAIALEPSRRRFIDFANVGYYAPFAYAPQAIVFAVLRPFNIRPIFLFYAGRIAGLLTWVWILYLAIGLIPYHRWTLALCALLPASLFLHSSLSGDTLINALAFLLFARLLQLIFEKEKGFRLKEGGILIALSIVITLNKVVYAPLLALFFLIPVSKFTSRRLFWIWGIGLLLGQFLLLWWWYEVASDKFIPYDQYNPDFRDGQQINPGVDPSAQLHFIQQHPLEYLGTVLHSLFESLPATAAHYVGKFGWEKNYLPAPVVGVLLLALPLLSCFEDRSIGIPQRIQRLFFLGIAFIMTIGLATVLYMQWHPVGARRIIAFQGRYFIAILPLLWFTMKQRKCRLPQIPLLNGSLLVILFSLIWGIGSVLSRFWTW